MLVVTGFFENDTFIPDEPISFPQRKRVTVMIEEENESQDPTYKELAARAEIYRKQVEDDTGIIDVKSFIREGRNQ